MKTPNIGPDVAELINFAESVTPVINRARTENPNANKQYTMDMHLITYNCFESVKFLNTDKCDRKSSHVTVDVEFITHTAKL